MTAPTTTAEPTGLDHLAAYAAMYPGLQGQVRLQDAQDAVLKIVHRAARLRRAERERVKAAFLALAEYLDGTGDVPGAGDEIRQTAEQIR